MEAFVGSSREAGFGNDLEEIMLHYEKEDYLEKLA